MEFEIPLTDGFTVYSKSGCHNCVSVKKLLKDKNFLFKEIQCDEYLIEEKENFLLFIEKKIGKSYKTFPMVFYNGNFIGGFNDTTIFIKNLLLSFEEIF